MTYLVHQMGHLTIETPHLTAVVEEAQNVLGLRVVEQDDDRAVLTSNARRAEITYVRAERSALRSVGLEAYDRDAVAEALRRVRAEGLHIVSEAPTAPGAEWGFSFRGPFGHVIEVHTAVPRDQPAEYATEGVRPKRLDHVNMLAEDPVRMRDILARVLGMQLSDRSDGDEFQFLRAGDLMHHTIALIKGPSALHHFSLEAAQLVDLCRLADRLRLAGRTLLWGPGHHGANAQSYFTYHHDITGCIVEYSNGMTRIDNERAYRPGTWPAVPKPDEDWLNLWGAPPPGMFVGPGLPLAGVPAASEAA